MNFVPRDFLLGPAVALAVALANPAMGQVPAYMYGTRKAAARETNQGRVFDKIPDPPSAPVIHLKPLVGVEPPSDFLAKCQEETKAVTKQLMERKRQFRRAISNDEEIDAKEFWDVDRCLKEIRKGRLIAPALKLPLVAGDIGRSPLPPVSDEPELRPVVEMPSPTALVIELHLRESNAQGSRVMLECNPGDGVSPGKRTGEVSVAVPDVLEVRKPAPDGTTVLRAFDLQKWAKAQKKAK